MSEVLVLCYHAISPNWPATVSVTPEALERQLTSFVRRGWRGATFHDAVFNPPAARTLAVTFDDAYASVRERAFPILERLGLPGTVFVPTAFISGRERLSWPGLEHWVRTPHAAELIPMEWPELGELADAGWEIGSHTRTHPWLTRLDDEAAAEELGESRAECAQHLGRACRTIAYPFGDVDERIAAMAERAGYAAGASLSTRLEPRGPYRWPRVGIYDLDVGWRFKIKASRSSRRARASSLWPGGGR